MAVMAWKEANGVTPDLTTITFLKHKTKDEYQNNTDYAIPIPPTGHNYGFGKTFCLWSVTCSEVLSNFKLYGGGLPGWTGVKLYIGDEVSDTYDQAEGTENETGSELVAYHSEVTSKTDFFATYTVSNKKSIALIGGAGSKTGNDQRFSKYIFMQMDVEPTAVHGALANGSIIGVYDLA